MNLEHGFHLQTLQGGSKLLKLSVVEEEATLADGCGFHGARVHIEVVPLVASDDAEEEEQEEEEEEEANELSIF